MENKKLYKTKIQLLESLEQSSFNFKFSLNFQGIALNFHTNIKNFKDLILQFTPAAWSEDQSLISPINIYHTDIQETIFNINSFGDESSQDCFFIEDKVIHRDFASKRNDKNSFSLICSHQDSDGFFNFMRMLMPKLLFSKNKYIIHSSCVLTHNKEALLFLGHSGHGKSTMASLAGDRLILSDDMNILDMNNLQVNAACLGHAYHTNGSYDESFPIKKMFWILKDFKNEEAQMTQAKASLLLLSSITNLFWDQLTKTEIEKVMIDVNIITQKISMSYLHFEKDESIWSIID